MREEREKRRKELLEIGVSNSNLDNKQLLVYLLSSCKVLTREKIDKIGNVLVENSKKGIKEPIYQVCKKAEIEHMPKYSYYPWHNEDRIKAKDIYLDHVCFGYDFPDKPLEFTPDKIPPSVFEILNQNNPCRSLVSDLEHLVSFGDIGNEYRYKSQEVYYINGMGESYSRALWLYFIFFFKPYLTKDDLIVAGNNSYIPDFNKPYLTKKTSIE